MPCVVRIRLSGTSVEDLNSVCEEIRSIARRTGVRMRGPVALPAKRLVAVVGKTPCGGATHTFSHWRMRIHKRIIDLDADERIIRHLMRIRVPKTVRVEIEVLWGEKMKKLLPFLFWGRKWRTTK